MTTIKSFTSLEQSKKLAEILPIESADMAYYQWKDDGHLMSPVPFVLDGMEEKEDGVFEYISCWSLAALLGVLPNDTSLLYFDDAYQMVYDKKPYVISDKFDNPVDACYEIILKLNELNLL